MPRKILGLVLFTLATCATFPAEGQKNELNSMRCDRKFTYKKNTPCTHCALPSQKVKCPSGWSVNDTPKPCRYTVKLGENTLSILGCNYICKKEGEEKQCCSGYWGPECYECPGGLENVCNQHGTCLDGIGNNGTCICNANYGGFACQDCKDENHFGLDCQSVCECQHGVCNHGPSGDGRCTCYAGYTGPRCDQEVPNCGGVICEANSLCVVKNGKAECECIPGYKKIGIYCLAQDPCYSSPCSPHAVCKTVEETKYQCICAEGYEGNGRVCQVRQPCLDNNGGCPRNTTNCIVQSTGKPYCLCKAGMKREREGINNCIPTNECPISSCDTRTQRCEMTPDGFVNCICPKGEIDVGGFCYKTILSEIVKKNRLGRYARQLNDAVTLFGKGCSLALENYGPFTVLVPTGQITPRFNFSVSYAQEFCRKHIIVGQHVLKNTRAIQVFWTLSGHKVECHEWMTPVKYSYSDSPNNFYSVIDSNLPAVNGVIHLVNHIRKMDTMDNSDNAQKTIAEILASMEIASRFETILENCGLPSILDGPGPFTVFVPSNEAVDKLRDGRLIYLFTEGINKLQELVKHHIYPTAAVYIERLITMPHILTMANQLLTVDISNDGRILLDNSKVEINKRDILASNGIIHTLDGILIPSSILPILPKKCNEVHHKVVEGSCVDCELLNSSLCPPGSQIREDKAFSTECVYTLDPLGLNVLKKGCQAYCTLNEVTYHCSSKNLHPFWQGCMDGRITILSAVPKKALIQVTLREQINQVASMTLRESVNDKMAAKKFNPSIPPTHIIRTNPSIHKTILPQLMKLLGLEVKLLQGKTEKVQLPVEKTPGCCKGFFGHSCTPCPGGYSNPCYDKGSCNDGIHGNGQCNCYDGFKGIACHICSNPNKHGENCTEDCGCIHGICDNRPGSKGVCQAGTCADGYIGEFCDMRFHSCESTGATLNCHVHATCTVNDTANCVCLDGYEGDGFSCKPIDACSKPGRGGCSENATCTSTGPGTVSCQCIRGWTGDGKACAVVDNCVTETRGGCHIDADCNYIGPGQSSCTCKKDYQGDGYVCDKINPCLMDNGGCHALAVCQILNTGEKDCRCPSGYMGDGIQCYGDMMTELATNYHCSSFYHLMTKSLFMMPRGANLTVLVPMKEAVSNFSKGRNSFWLESNMLPSLIRSHILQGSFTIEQLKSYVGQELPTLNPDVKWEIKSNNSEIVIQNASIMWDIPAVNGSIYLISKVLVPFVKLPPGLQEQLNSVPSFWRFKELLERYQLVNKIESSAKYTIFVPGNNSIEKYCQASNITQLDNDTMQYHVVIVDKLFLKDLKNGVHRSTMLGFSNWLMFSNRLNKTYVNRILLDGPFVETRNGMLIGVSQVLPIHKNRCTTNTTTVQKSRCAKCNKRIKCPAGSVLAQNPGQGNLPHCVFKSGGMKLVGCYFTCVKVSLVSVCCPGYYGVMCEMCPGEAGNWCSGNGLCQDGIEGSGECQCREGFHGTACEMCQAGRYGPKCQSECNCNKGQCSDGLLGDGRCTCNAGFKGVNCDQEIETDFCNGTCDVNANCMNDSTTSQPTCSCSAGYSGNGTSCTEIDPCAEDNGGCSIYANCTKIAPGKNICSCKEGYSGDGTLCRELDRCLENNGGCHQNATCTKTGPGLVACACLPSFTGDGINKCEYTHPCLENNGGCSPLALCLRKENGNRICLCILGSGDGFTCHRTVWQELIARQDAFEFLRYIRVHRVMEMLGKGPYTVFVPHADYIQKRTTFSEWEKAGCIKDLLRYHTVTCQMLLADDLESQDSITALSGHKIRVSVKENSLYLNDEVKIIESDITRENGVIHFIDGILAPYDLQHQSIPCNQSQKTIIEVAKAHGYNIYSKLLKETGLLNLVNDTIHQPFTMLWPTDEAFNSLPAEMQQWLYHKDHRSKLSAYLKGHMVRDIKVLASKLTVLSSLRTLHGSTISFSCSKTNAGDIVVDNGNARIVQRYMEFNVGIAYGTDHLLEPPDLGSRCDQFQTVEISNAPCGTCGFEKPCPLGSMERGEIQTCYYEYDLFEFSRRPYWRLYSRVSIPKNRLRKQFTKGCKKTCLTTKWVPQCCANHYGRNCHVCPGGLEAPCQNRGTCDDGHQGSGQCNCRAAFVGVACELCAPGYYGPDCKECNCSGNGICNEGLLGDGFCFCSVGWTGDHCETKLVAVPQCSPACHPNAVCRANNICECNLYYEGDGKRCTVIDQCGNNNGGCSNHAECTQNGTDVSCTCLTDYQGDGYICNPIDRCADGRNGHCSEHATCISTGPNTRRCECKAGYIGNGMQCFEEVIPPTDRCLEENGQCHVEAICTDLHFEDKTVGVFHLQSPIGKYRFTYEDAEASCAVEGATLATLQQLSAAQQMGFHLCIVGWLFNRTAGYPTVYPSQNCGTHHVGIVNYGYRNNVSEKWDAYCYQIQDVQCNCRDGYIGDGYSCTGSLLDVLAQQANFSVFYSIILDFANTTQEGVDFFNFLSEDIAYKTLFVPLNSGFGDNTSLSLKDVKLHASLRDVILSSFNLTAGTIIPSQAGYNLSIAESLSHTFLIVSELINDTVIVEWDIVASNGIIHAIQSPLKVPLQYNQVSNTVKPSAAMTIGISTVFAVILLCTTIAGLTYFCLKRRNQLIHFRYFRAELDDDEPSWQGRSPHLVSIPNPIYGADSSIYEPFEESLHKEDFVDTEDILGQ